MNIKTFLVFAALIVGISAQYSCPSTCSTASCRCGSTKPPTMLNGDTIPPEEIPQFVLITFDDAVQPITVQYYQPLILNNNITDARGCQPRGTFFISNMYTDYHVVQQLYAAGHDISAHTVTHSTSVNSNVTAWTNELTRSRNLLSSLSVIPKDTIVGVRAPYLQHNNDMYISMKQNGFLYDSSWGDHLSRGIATSKNMTWPYTFDYFSPQAPNVGTPVTTPHLGIWELPMNVLYNGNTVFGLMDPPITGAAYTNMLKENFDRNYNGNKSPFGIFIHPGGFLGADPQRITSINNFFAYAVSKPNVFFATTKQVIQWMQNPIPASQISSQSYMFCPSKPKTPTTEVCNGIDDNMNGQIDEGLVKTCCFQNGCIKTCSQTCPVSFPDINSNIQPYDVPCGDGICQTGENCMTCEFDCGSCYPTSSGSTTGSVTSQGLTSKAVTSQPLTTRALSTKPLTTQPITSASLTTDEITSQSITSQSLTTQEQEEELTTSNLPELTSAPVTSASVTSAPVTSASVTSSPVTSARLTSSPMTSSRITSSPLTTKMITTSRITTGSSTSTSSTATSTSSSTTSESCSPMGLMRCVSGTRNYQTCVYTGNGVQTAWGTFQNCPPSTLCNQNGNFIYCA